MDNPATALVRAGPTPNQSALLNEILQQLVRQPDGVDALRFNARHDQQLADIRALIDFELLKRRDNRYTVPLLGMSEIAKTNALANSLLYLCGHIFTTLRKFYKKHTGDKITIRTLSKYAEVPERDVRRALTHMMDLMILGGRSNDLERPDSYVIPSEKILDYNTFDDVLAELRSWRDQAASQRATALVAVTSDNLTPVALPLLPVQEEGVAEPTMRDRNKPLHAQPGAAEWVPPEWHRDLPKELRQLFAEIVGSLAAGHRAL